MWHSAPNTSCPYFSTFCPAFLPTEWASVSQENIVFTFKAVKRLSTWNKYIHVHEVAWYNSSNIPCYQASQLTLDSTEQWQHSLRRTRLVHRELALVICTTSGMSCHEPHPRLLALICNVHRTVYCTMTYVRLMARKEWDVEWTGISLQACWDCTW